MCTPGTTDVSALDGDRVMPERDCSVVAGSVTYLWLWPSAQTE